MKRADPTQIPTDILNPFKIFLSLLDKWEIGSPLSEVLAIPSLTAIKTLSVAASTVLAEEVSARAILEP